MQSEAAPGEVVVSDSLWRLLPSAVATEPLGVRKLKGVERPVALFRVVTAGQKAAGQSAPKTPFVGRANEWNVLRTEWTGVQSGLARFVCLRGEPGIGKSRLVEEFLGSLERPDIDVLEIRCTQYSQDSAFLAVIELIERRLGLDRSIANEAQLDRIDNRLLERGITESDAAPLLAELLSIPAADRYPPLVISPIRRRARTLDILLALVKAVATQVPTLLVVEDLHWADPSTLELLQMLISAPPRLPLLGLLTARPEFQPAWVDAHATAIVDLSRLDSAEVKAMVRSAAHDKDLPDEVIRQIVQRSDGVALFVEEVTREVIESGVLVEHEHAWQLIGSLPTGLVPASLDASIAARLDRLGEARATAQLAATIGREFPYALLRAVSDRSEAKLGDDLQRIVDSGLASQTFAEGAETFVFKHALVQESAYKSLLRATRQRHHERIASTLLSEFKAEVEHRPEVVARHLSGAGHYAEASDYWLAAGLNALPRVAMPEAHAHFARALDDLKRLPPSAAVLAKELDLQIAIAPTLMTVNGWGSPTVAEACKRARDLAIELDRPDKMYPPIWGIWTNHFLRGEMDEAVVAARAALEMAEASGVTMIRITGRHASAYTHLYRGEFEETVSEADAGLALFDLEQERVLADTFQLSSSIALRTARATALWMLARLDEAELERERMIGLGRGLGHTPSLAAALAFQLHIGLCRGWHARDVDEQVSVADELLALCEDEGFSMWHAVALTYRGAAAAVQGAATEARRLMQEGLAEFVQTGARLTLVPMNVMCAEAWDLLGEPGKAWSLLDEAQSEADIARGADVGAGDRSRAGRLASCPRRSGRRRDFARILHSRRRGARKPDRWSCVPPSICPGFSRSADGATRRVNWSPTRSIFSITESRDAEVVLARALVSA